MIFIFLVENDESYREMEKTPFSSENNKLSKSYFYFMKGSIFLHVRYFCNRCLASFNGRYCYS